MKTISQRSELYKLLRRLLRNILRFVGKNTALCQLQGSHNCCTHEALAYSQVVLVTYEFSLI